MHRLRKLFAGWAASFLVHTRHAAARVVHDHEGRAAAARAGRQGLVSAVTRMRMTVPDLYRAERRNAPRPGGRRWGSGGGCACLRWWILRLVHGSTVICALLARGCGLRVEMADALFFFLNSGFGRLP